jgi:peptidyl-prolyl cis-trans isomerase B (cyclophilin B)
VFPGLRSRRTVSYVQLHVDGVPTGPALTIQPMLDAIVPMTVEGYRSDGSTYPRVAGWRTQQELAAMSRGDDDEDEGDEDGVDDRGEMPEGFDPDHLSMIDRGRPAEEALADPSRRLRGHRLYLERDVLLDTSAGAIRIALRPDYAPETVWNFRVLVQRGFYDGLTFFRIVPMTVDGLPFIIQAGDPTGRGHGGPGYALPLEPSGLAHDFGVISMARGDEPDSAGSQFFIALSREGTAMLDGQYCAFGYAVSGREAILAIADGQLEDMQRGRSRVPVVIHQARLVDATPRLTGRGRVEQRVQRAAARRDEPPLPPQRIPR